MRQASVIFCLLFWWGCGSKPQPKTNVPNGLVLAYSQGLVSRMAPIQVEFSRPVTELPLNSQDIELIPPVSGKWQIKDDRFLVFYPEGPLPIATAYTARIPLARLFSELGKDDLFEFQFTTLNRGYSLSLGPLQLQSQGDARWQMCEGILTSQDWESPEDIASLLSVKLDDRSLEPEWTHSPDGRYHRFSLNNLERRNRKQQLKVYYDATHFGVDFRGEEVREISPVDSFEMMYLAAATDPKPHILIAFSDALDRDQDLLGLIHSSQDLDFTIEGNIVRAFPKKYLGRDFEVTVEPGIRNQAGALLGQKIVRALSIPEMAPQIRLVGQGIITPQDGRVVFPFETVNLSAVDVQIIKVLEQNIHQFFQVNQIDQNSELYRVGEVVASRKIELDPENKRDLRQWARHNLDLNPLINLDPGALYRVELGFKASYILYSCPEGLPEDRKMLKAPTFEEESQWDYWFEGYRWDRRDDPCHVSFYRNDRVIARNIFVTNLGLIAKSAGGDRLDVSVNNLMTTEPVSGVYLEVLDFKRQVVATGSTNGSGFASLTLKDSPFLLVARKGSQSAYLKLLDGTSNSLSRFDVGGAPIRSGINGFLYGERGVWRPGDAVHLTFLLNDPEQVLPANHPVSLEMTSPRGNIVDRQVMTTGVDGFYAFTIQSETHWETGTYLARVRVGDHTFERTVKIETIVPNRLKLAFKPADEILVAGQSGQASIEAEWLHGAIARNLKTDLSLQLSADKKAFSQFEGYSFNDITRTLRFDPVPLFEGTLDDQGQVNFELEYPQVADAPGALTAQFTCRVFEAGGGFSIDQFSLPYHPFTHYVGFKTPKGDAARGMILTDVDHPVEILSIDQKGQPIARSGIEVTLYKVDWHWWIENNVSDSQFQQAQLSSPLDRKFIDTDEKGFGVYTLRVNYPEWGRYLLVVKDPDGHVASKTLLIDWPGWAGRGQEDNPGAAAMLQFTSDKSSYQVGDTVSLNIPTGQAGRLLVSLEGPERVLHQEWVEARYGMTVFKFQVTRSMVPNVYAHVTLIQPHQNTANDRPIRLYGVLPIEVLDPAARLEPVLSMADELQPETSAVIQVREKTGRPMTYTLAVVDEGLLGLTRFQTPDPYRHFFARQALFVKTWDVYPYVLGALTGDLEALLSVGGDEEGKANDAAKKPNRFPPLVRFLGPFTLEAGQTGKHQVDIPNTIGAVRTMVVAAHQGTFGRTEKSTPIRKPLMVLGTLPRVLGPDESLDFPVSIFVGQEGLDQVEVRFEASEGIEFGLKNPTQMIKTQGLGEYSASCPIRVVGNAGWRHLKVHTKAGNMEAIWETDIEVRLPNPPAESGFDALVEAGKTWETQLTAIGVPGTNQGSIELSVLPPLNLENRLGQLIHYPHGCLEQTTSGAFPQLFLSSLMDLPPQRVQEIRGNISAAFAKFNNFQLSDGHLSYWPGSGYYSEWSDCYAGHFLVEAKAMGYLPPAGLLEKWLGAQARRANQWLPGEEELPQAYRLFVLARAGQAEVGAMNRFRDSGLVKSLSRWLLAAGYQLVGRAEVARQLVAQSPLYVEDYREETTFGSALRDQSVILMCLLTLNQKERAQDVIRSVSKRLASPGWLSTHETSFGLLSMAQLARDLSSGIQAAVQIGKQPSLEFKLQKALQQHSFSPPEGAPFNLAVSNQGSGVLFAYAALKGVPSAGTEQAESKGLELRVTYADLKGNALDVRQLALGVDFWIQVQVVNRNPSGPAQNLALSLVTPSGWQLANPRMAAPDSSESTLPAGVLYQDYRDDRVFSYFNLKTQESLSLKFLVNASYRGHFYLPAVRAEAMYDRGLYAQTAGQWVEVGQKP